MKLFFEGLRIVRKYYQTNNIMKTINIMDKVVEKYKTGLGYKKKIPHFLNILPSTIKSII